MDRTIIPFDKEVISVDELKEHVEYYVGLANKGENLLQLGEKSQAREILRDINKDLEKEYRYYDKSAVSKVMEGNTLYSTYYWAIAEAYAKQNNKNSYDYLSSNFYDIKDYLTSYGMETVLESV